MNKFNPKVSIIIPAYNGSDYLNEAIDSALAQTYKNIEIIVINDGSNDDGATDKVAKSYRDKIRYFNKEKNGGVSTALNLGIKKMTGKYFSWLSHDDMYYPNKIEKQIKELTKLKNKKIILYSNYSLLENNEMTNVILDHEMLVKKEKYSLLRGVVNGITPLIQKDIMDEIGYFDTKLRCTQDYEYWHKIQKKYKFVHMKDVLAITRLHSKQVAKLSPNVAPEGDILWIKMIKDLTESEKIQYEGSFYNFYLEMIRFLKVTPYLGALEYCKNELEEIEKNIFNNIQSNVDLRDYVLGSKNENANLIESLSILKNENANLAKSVSNIYNSRRFKYIDKMANLKDRIFK